MRVRGGRSQRADRKREGEGGVIERREKGKTWKGGKGGSRRGRKKIGVGRAESDTKERKGE